MAETEVKVPWIDDPVPMTEAIEVIAQASEDDAETLESRISSLEERIHQLEAVTEISCPSCGSDDQVMKSAVAAAVLVDRGSLSQGSIDALNRDSHVCMECNESFTPGHDIDD